MNGKPKTLADIIERQKQERARFNAMIGTYVEKGYTFVRSNPGINRAIFYHHANNEIQDDIVFVDVQMEEETKTEHRTLISRSELFKIADEVRDIESLKQK